MGIEILYAIGALLLLGALIWGAKDWCFPPDVFMAEFQQRYPNAFARIIEDAGHYLLEDSPEETLAAIRDFLEK